MTKLDRATAFRILTYLVSLGYIFKDTSTNLYSLGYKIFDFGDKSDFLKTLTTLCFENIKKLAHDTQHITYLAVLEGPHIVYCDKVDPTGDDAPRSFRMRQDAIVQHWVSLFYLSKLKMNSKIFIKLILFTSTQEIQLLL